MAPAVQVQGVGGVPVSHQAARPHPPAPQVLSECHWRLVVVRWAPLAPPPLPCPAQGPPLALTVAGTHPGSKVHPHCPLPPLPQPLTAAVPGGVAGVMAGPS